MAKKAQAQNMTEIAAAMRAAGFSAAEVMAALSGVKGAPHEKAHKEKTATFTKKDGTKVACTPAQAKIWSAYVDRAQNREHNLAEWEKSRKAYKPNKAIKDAIKAHPTMTRKEAMEFGFVGTKEDLRNLKAQLLKK